MNISNKKLYLMNISVYARGTEGEDEIKLTNSVCAKNELVGVFAGIMGPFSYI